MADPSEQLLGRTMLRDRYRLTKSRDVDSILESAAEAERRGKLVPDISYPDELPVSQKRDEIAAAIREHQVVIIAGETGSGKTTQLPKICLDAGRGVYGTIGHTQPRRIAARSVADRIRSELAAPIVGYKVRFTDETGPETLVKLMTDGILLAETQRDRFLNQYDTLIIDEAHERSLNIDFLLGYLHRLLPQRPDLKLIITSATIDVQRFSEHFGDAPIIEVSGRTYPVDVRYDPLTDPDEEDEDGEPIDQAILRHCRELAREAPSPNDADTLVFLTGEREIREVADTLSKAQLPNTKVLPLFARLSGADQMKIFKGSSKRRIVLATNIAETSLTVPGIRYVIDPGLARISRYSTRSRVQRLPIERISQASANQRAGRCGRVSDGVCVRLYSEDDFNSRPEFTEPEVLRTNLASVILQMMTLRLGEPEAFPFIDPPDYRQLREGFKALQELQALDARRRLTPTGRKLARLPVDPKIARMVLAAAEWNCVNEVLVLAAALSIQDPRERPLDKKEKADEAHAKFADPAGDFLSLLKLWNEYRTITRERSGNQARKWCVKNFLSVRRMREWSDVQRQLREIAHELRIRGHREPAKPEHIHRALLAGLVSNIGDRNANGTTQHEYAGVNGRRFFIFPGSALFDKKPAWVMAAELVETARLYARTVAPIDPEWVEHAAEHLVKRSYTDPQWDTRRQSAICFEKVTLGGLAIIPKRCTALAPHDPKTARQLFIQHALVDGDFETGAAFFKHNAELVRELQLMQSKTRRRDILAGPEVRYDFYDAKLPASVVDAVAFERWRKDAEETDRRVLFMSTEDLLLRSADDLPTALFPDTITAGDVELKLRYRFDPGHVADGVTARVRLADLHRVDPRRLDWLVPGLLEERCVDLIRTLPKPLRVQCVPAPQFAANAVHWMDYGVGDFYEAFAKSLGKQSGTTIPPDAFDLTKLADYLKMNVRVVNEKNKPIAHGRDIRALQKALVGEARDALSSLPDSPWIRDDVTVWDFPDLPDRVEFKHDGRTIQGFPAIVDEGDAVSLRLLESEAAARKTTREGVRRLFALDYARELELHMGDVPGIDRMAVQFTALGGGRRLKTELARAVADKLARDDPREIRSRAQFEEALESAWNRLRPTTEAIARTAADILDRYYEVQQKLNGKHSVLLDESLADMREQLMHLMPADFLTATPVAWLPHLPRYLRAIGVRHDKLANAGLKRDLRQMADVRPLWEAYLRIPEDADPAVVNGIRWHLEELRVQLFAQELGTSVKVSPQRIGSAIESTGARIAGWG
ncbi:MAG: ATP-dependent RNA helicase HrpA [Planctomycetota bacterium]